MPQTYTGERTAMTSIISASDEEASILGGSVVGSALEAETWVLVPHGSRAKVDTFIEKVDDIAPFACPGT